MGSQEQFFLTKMKSLLEFSTVTSFGRTSNMLWINGRVVFEVGFRAKNEVQRRLVSEQFRGSVEFALGSEEAK